METKSLESFVHLWARTAMSLNSWNVVFKGTSLELVREFYNQGMEWGLILGFAYLGV